MKLNIDPFPVGMVELMDKKILVRTDQAEMTKGKNVVVFDELHNWMIKPQNLEIGMRKENMLQKPAKRVNPTSAMLIEKYQRQLEEDRRYRVTRGIKRTDSSKPGTGRISGDHGVHGSPRGGRCNTLQIGNPG
jgi:hypothetical protein